MKNDYYFDVNDMMSKKYFCKNRYNQNQYLKLDEIIKNFTKKKIRDRCILINNFIKYDIDGSWYQKILDSDSKVSPRDASSLNAYIIRYGETVGKKLHEERQKAFIKGGKEEYLKTHTLQEWMEVIRKKRSIGLKCMIDRYGKNEGIKRWKNYLVKWKLSIEKTKNSKKWKNGATLNEYIEKYGKYKGTELYYLKIAKFKKSNSLIGYVEKYGKKDGELRWNNMCKSHSLSKEKFISLHGKKIGLQKYKCWLEGISTGMKGQTYSKISQELFWKIYDLLDEQEKDLCNFKELNNEIIIYPLDKIFKFLSLDFMFKNKIIEFDGTYWHSFDEIKKKDVLRDVYLTKLGYDILRIPELDYKKNKSMIVEQCINFLRNENERPQFRC